MKRHDLSKLYVWLAAFHWAPPIRRPAQDSTTQTSPILLFVAITLFLILAILEVDLHRTELRLLGILGEDGTDPALMGP